MNLSETLKTLSAANGPTGREYDATAAAAGLLKPFVDGVSWDALNNLFGFRLCGKPGAKRVLLDAHLDEVCLYVSGWDHGFLRFVTGGGIDARILPDTEVTVLCDPPVSGVITCLPPHILSKEEQERAFDAEKLRIDCAMTEEQAEKIPVGTPIVWRTEPFAMCNHMLCGKALDNRAGFAVLIRAMELIDQKEIPCDIVVLGSVGEELGILGAKTGAFSMMPDAAVVVDVTFGLQPDVEKLDAKALGSGAAIGICPMLSQKQTACLIQLAKENGIRYTTEIMPGNPGTNASATQISRTGIPTTMISVPLRYMHTPREVVSLEDVEACAQLLARYLLQYGSEDM